MTELSPAVATSKTKPALRGFYGGVGGNVDLEESSREEVRAHVSRVVTGAINDEHPAPFKLTKVSAAEEELIATQDVRRVLALTGRKAVVKPVLWVDGPLDLGLTVMAIFNRKSSDIPHFGQHIIEASTKLAWERARERVEQLPKELLSKKGAERRYDSGHHYSTVKMLADGSLGRFYDAKLVENQGLLTTGYLREAGNVVTELRPLTERIGRLTPIQALLANTQEYPSSSYQHRNSVHFNTVRDRIGAKRADLVAVMAGLLETVQSQARIENRSVPADLHQVFNFNRASSLASILFTQRLLRETTMSGSNWTDPDREALLRVFFGVAAHVSLSTFDILCHAPTTYVENATALTLDNVEALMDKPTVHWDDGSEFYIYDGVELNPDLVRSTVAKPSTLLDVRNVEQRRVLLRLVGTEAVLRDVKATKVSEDDFGELFKLPNGAQFVLVYNATAEPDGSFRKYILGTVGDNHKTARSGIASTWGLREDQYWPTRET